jgi:hypothetical protein
MRNEARRTATVGLVERFETAEAAERAGGSVEELEQRTKADLAALTTAIEDGDRTRLPGSMTHTWLA